MTQITFMSLRQSFQKFFRRFGCLQAAEDVHCVIKRIRCFRENQIFQKSHPDFPTPPINLLYEIGGRVRLENYFLEGQQSSAFLANQIKQWIGDRPVQILDWGCGVACVVRHMPAHFGSDSRIFGSDYNQKMINWAQRSIPSVAFSTNGLLPPLEFERSSLDWIYGLSVLTHLSDESLRAWFAEFHRILKPEGILTLTTNGSGCDETFFPEEREEYQNRGFVIRGKVGEGRKMYLTYHNPDYFRKVVSQDWDVLGFSPRGMAITKQDLWWLRPKSGNRKT